MRQRQQRANNWRRHDSDHVHFPIHLARGHDDIVKTDKPIRKTLAPLVAVIITGPNAVLIRALGFFGVISLGMYHQAHHMAPASGSGPPHN